MKSGLKEIKIIRLRLNTLLTHAFTYVIGENKKVSILCRLVSIMTVLSVQSDQCGRGRGFHQLILQYVLILCDCVE